ncbi:hypothetical protein M0802_011574 [Mischocyttarus mexicanus]|nr:hypothetical protein M0802_011574 [Mischocyttarus mexicanus]
MSKISSAQYQSQQKRLPLSTKLEVLKLLDAGSTKTEVAGRYNVTRTAIYKIAKNRKEILKYFAGPTCKLGLKKKINLKPSTNVVLDEILFNWLSQTRQQGIPVNGPLICQTALKINKNIGGPDNFKASDGWLYAFKNRYGVRKRPINGEKVLENTEGAQKFIQKFSNFVKEHGYQDENIFNVDESADCYCLLASAWQQLSAEILVAAWSKLKQQDSNDCSGQNIVSENECSTNNEVANIKDFIEKIPGYEKCTLLDIEKMLNEDFHDQGWEPQDLQSLTEQVLSKHDFIGPKNDLAEKQNTKSAINVDECNRLDEVVSNCENYKVTEDSVMDIDNDLETPVNVILDNAVVEKNNLINNENSNQKALEAIKVIRHWYSNNCDKNQADVINELKTLDNIEHRIAK